jgi:hypothetical protein
MDDMQTQHALGPECRQGLHATTHCTLALVACFERLDSPCLAPKILALHLALLPYNQIEKT